MLELACPTAPIQSLGVCPIGRKSSRTYQNVVRIEAASSTWEIFDLWSYSYSSIGLQLDCCPFSNVDVVPFETQPQNSGFLQALVALKSILSPTWGNGGRGLLLLAFDAKLIVSNAES